MNPLNELSELMALGLQRGWAKLPPASNPITDSRIRRLRFKAQGLTARGTVPKTKGSRYVRTGLPAHRPISKVHIHAHPLIQRLKSGGDAKKYHQVYMRLWRGMPVDDLLTNPEP